MVLLGGVGITFLAGWFVDNYRRDSRDQQIELQTDNATYAVRVALDRIAIAVQAVRALYASNRVTQDQFGRFVKTLTSSEAIRSLGFYRRVTQDMRESYEDRFRTEPARTLGIWQYGDNGEPISAPEKPFYFVIESGYLLSGDEPSYGLDVSSLPGRIAAIGRASQGGELVATQAIEFLNTDTQGVLLYVPIQDQSGVEIGVAAGSVALQDLSNIARLASGVADVEISLVGDGAVVAAAENAGEEAAPLDQRSFKFGDQTWSVIVTPMLPTADFAGWAMLLVVGAGLAATAALLAYLSTLAKTLEVTAARARLAGMLDGLGPLAWLLERDGTIVSANRSAVAQFDDGKSIVGSPFWKLPFSGMKPEQADRIMNAIAAANRREDVRFDLDIEGDESRQVLDLWIRPLGSAQGGVDNLVASAVDVTDRYESEETQRLLMRELDHRMKNTLQVIQAIIRTDRQISWKCGKIRAIAPRACQCDVAGS